jgi:chaperonin GroES
MKLKPLQDWAVIRASSEEEMTAGGLYIPDTAKQKPQEGMVVAIGPGALEEEKFGKKKDDKKERRFIPTTVKPGEFVIFEKYAGKTYKIDGEDLILVRERDILGALPEGGKRGGAKPKVLQIPAKTSGAGVPAPIGKSRSGVPATVPVSGATKKKAAKKSPEKPKKKSVKKTVKKTVKKAVKKAVKKTAVKKVQSPAKKKGKKARKKK